MIEKVKQQPEGFNLGGYNMKDKLSKVIKSGKDADRRSYNLTVTCTDMTPEQAQEDAFHYYVWKVQRVIRDADEASRAKWAKDGLTLHFSEVGKAVKTVEQTVESMSDEQARKAYDMLKAKFGKQPKV
jgi:hypothetical protein